MPILVFPPREPFGADDEGVERARDLAIALLRAQQYHPELITSDDFASVVKRLRQSVLEHPEDLDGQEALGQVLSRLGRTREAVAVYEQILSSRPRREEALVLCAHGLNTLGECARAIKYWQQAVELNPWMERYWFDLGYAYSQLARWSECREASRRAVDRFPTHIGLRQLLVASHLHLGDIPAAKEEFARIVQFDPPGMDVIQQWWDSHPLR
jgi:tetratricopeptide (TPR) repeat protein